MGIFKKKPLTTDEKLEKAKKEKQKALKKRDKLDKKHENDPFSRFDSDYANKRKNLNQNIAQAIEDEKHARRLAIEEAKHPKPAPKSVKIDNSKVFAPKVETHIGSDNKATLEAHGHYHGGSGKRKK